MTIGETYLIRTALLGIHSVDGTRIPVMIPVGASVILELGPLDGTRMVDIKWEGKTVTIFTVDLRERGTLLPKAADPAASSAFPPVR
jgi:hypothetical protein